MKIIKNYLELYMINFLAILLYNIVVSIMNKTNFYSLFFLSTVMPLILYLIPLLLMLILSLLFETYIENEFLKHLLCTFFGLVVIVLIFKFGVGKELFKSIFNQYTVILFISSIFFGIYKYILKF